MNPTLEAIVSAGLWLGGFSAGVLWSRWRASRRAAPPMATAPPDATLRAIAVDAMSEGLIALDRAGRVAFANPAAVRLLGLRDLPDGAPMQVLAVLPRLRSSVVEAWATEAAVARDLELPSYPPRTLWVRITPRADGAVVILLDVTEVRRIEARWRRFVGDAAHELRTPVAAALANVELLAEDLDGRSAPQQANVTRAERQVRRLQGLVEQLSRLARLDAGEALRLERVSVADALASAALDRPPEDRSRLTVADSSGADVRVDRDAFDRVLENLIGNALRYSAGPVSVTSCVDGPSVIVAIEDRGPGIPADERENVFQRFYRLEEGRERARGGSGLGLALARELMVAMSGSVRLEEAAPHGTRAVVTLPRWVDADTASPPDAPASAMLLP